MPEVGNQGGRCDLVIVRGVDFEQIGTIKDSGTPRNITGYTFQAKLQYKGQNTPIATFTCSLVDAANGKFKWAMTAANTALLDYTQQYEWDIVYTVSGVTSRLLYGMVKVVEGATT